MKIFYLAVCWGSLAALPQSPIIVDGSVSLVRPSSTSVEITSTDRAIIDWSEFSIGENERAHFIQPSASASVLNRVITDCPSLLLGQMTSNGQVILINPNGVLVGRDAVINTGSFIASTLDLQNSVYLARQELLFQGVGGEVSHEGAITASHGDVILMGHRVSQLGTIDALNGDAALIAAPSVVLRGTGIQGMYVRSSAGGDPFEGAFVHFEGTTTAPGRTAYLLGDFVDLKSGVVDVSTAGQGGQIYVGGSYQCGDSSIPASLLTQVDANVVLKASGLMDGVGGRVVIWSDGRTDFQGRIETMGGTGGDAEVSGLKGLNYRGFADLRSFNSDGIWGTLLLDPSDIIIDSMASNPVFVPPTYDPAGAMGILDIADLNAGLIGANIVVQTNSGVGGNGDITLASTAVGGINWTANTKLTLRAQRHLILNNNIVANMAYTNLDDQIELIADSGNSGTGDIQVFQPFGTTIQVTTTDGAISMRGANILIADAAANGSVTIDAMGLQGRLTASTPGLLRAQAPTPGGSVLVNSSQDQTIGAGDWYVIGSGAPGLQATWSSSGAITANVTGETRVETIESGTLTIGAQILADIFRLQTANLTILAGTTNLNSSVLIQTTGMQNLNVSGLLKIQAGAFNTSYASLISGSTQTIQAGSLQVLGGTGDNADTEISSMGTQVITVTGLISMLSGSGALSNSTRSLITANAGNQTISAGSLFMQGGTALSNADVRIACVSGNQIVSTGALTMIGGTTPLQNGAGCDIFSAVGTQTVFASSISMTAGDQMNTRAEIRSVGNQIVNCTGDINMIGFFDPENVRIISGGTQDVTAANIYMNGAALMEIDLFIGGLGGVQTISVAQDFLLACGANPSGNASVKSATFPQIADIGRNLTLLGNASGSTTMWVVGDNSILNVGLDWIQLGNGGTANFTATENLIADIGRNYQLDSSTGTNAGFSCNDNLDMNIGVDLLIGSVGSLGGQSFSINNSSSCNIRVGNNCTLTGGASPSAQSQISLNSNYTLAVSNDILFQGGSGTDAYAHISMQSSLPAGSRLLIAGNDITFQGGSGDQSYAFSLQTSSHEILAGRDINITGGIGLGAQAYVFGAGGFPGIQVRAGLQAGRDISISGGSSAAGSSFGYAEVFFGELSLSAGRDIYLTAGANAANNHALIGTAWSDTSIFFPSVNDDAQTIIRAAGNFTAQNGPSGSIAYIDAVAAGIIEPTDLQFFFPPLVLNNNGSFTIQAAGDITLASGLNTSEAIPPFDVLIHDITMIADSPLATGALWTGTPDPFLSGSPLFSASPAVPTNALGGFKVETGFLANGIALTSVAGVIHVSSSDRFATGPTANLIIGPVAALNNLTLNSVSGDITVDPFHNIDITNAVTTGGNVLIIAQNNISMTGAGLISAGGNVELVCDNQAPLAPLVGLGAFAMDAGTSITAGGALRIFTARQPQNSILGLLNGISFVPGTIFTDTNQEMWCVYYPEPILGTPFTVFYKECLGALLGQVGLVVSEFLVELNPYGLYFPGWIERFTIDWPNESEPYFMRRRQLKPFNNPKTHKS